MQDRSVVARFDVIVFLAMPDDDAALAQVITESIDDFFVQKIKQPIAGVDEIHFDFEVAEHRGVFATDDAGSVNRDRLHMEIDVEDRVAVEDAWVIKVEFRRVIRPRSRRDDERLAAHDAA